MSRPSYITTSWDDGHVLDFRVAELLTKHGLTGTFYIPQHAQYGTMSPNQVRQLSENFDVGAHTIDHLPLTELPDAEAHRQISESKTYIEQLTGRGCPIFCPPRGWFTKAHLAMARQSGFQAVRTVEMFSLDYPRREQDLLIMPTTLQAHPHSRGNHLRNVLKRGAMRNLWLYVRHGGAGCWIDIVEALAQRMVHDGGVLHLWGHSWELESQGQWQRLDQALALLGLLANSVRPATNWQVCENRLEQPAALSAA